MRRIFILVEGQTEETFVNLVLVPYFTSFNALITPILLDNKPTHQKSLGDRRKPGRIFKGGTSTYSKIKNNVSNLLRRDKKLATLTTMLDFYGLPADFPNMEHVHGTCYEKAQQLEKAFADDIGNHRFVPFLLLHEFEALLFTDVAQFRPVLPNLDGLEELVAIGEQFDSPEEINDGPETHPSARIRQHIRGYRKVLHGPRIAEGIGLGKMRASCPHFNHWIETLEKISMRSNY